MYFRKGDLKMKKSKLSIGLVTSFIGALALTSCGSTPAVTGSDKSIVDFIGYNSKDEKLTIDIDKFYSEYGDSDEGTTLFYNAVLEALIRYEYKPLSERETTLKAYSALVKEADEKLQAQKRVAEDNASSNGTTYAEEMDKILESNSVETEDDLKEKFLYDLEKSAITDWYYTKNKDELKDQYIGLDKDWHSVSAQNNEFQSVFPYHILHILVKLDADANEYSRATITSAEAEKLWKVIRKLMDGTYTFEEVAYSDSEDTSNTAYGDVGIMSTQTSFYNEFKLGVYAYDAILSGVNVEQTNGADSNASIYKALGIDDEDKITTAVKNSDGVAQLTRESVKDVVQEQMVDKVKTAVTGYTGGQYATIPTVPYDVFRKMNEFKDQEKIGDSVEPEAGSTAYPRNVLFNQFLNFRSPFVITNEDISLAAGENEQVTLTPHNFQTGDLKLLENNFVEDAVPALAGKSVLTNGEGDVIIGVRSTAGIHFMVMRKSVFYNTNYLTQNNGHRKSEVTLQDYYTTDIPGGDNYPAETYVNMKKSDDPSYYTDRANTIKDKLKGADSSDTFDAAYDYRIYEMLLNDSIVKDKVVFFDKDATTGKSTVAENILKKIELLRLSKSLSNEESINSAWESYLAQLRHQNEIRDYKGMLPTTCAFRFSDKANVDDYNEKGGICNVK